MKKYYTTPELEVMELLAEDILSVSNDENLGIDIEIDGGDFFS